MMLNEIIAISNSNGMLSGTGRPQALKDGPFAGLCSFTDDPELQQQNFLSILSRLGAETIQVTTEESSKGNPKLAEGRLPDGVKTEDAFSEKPKEKQGKNCCAVKRLPTACPDTVGIVMGFVSLSDTPQSTLSAEPARHAADSENIEAVDSGSTVGEELPEMTANQGLSVNRNLQASNHSIPPVPDESDRDSAVQAKSTSNIQVKENVEIVKVSIADLTGTGRALAVPAEGALPKKPGQQTERSSAPELVSSDAWQSQTVGVQAPQTFQGWLQPGAETVSESETAPKVDFPRAVRIQAVPVQGLATEPVHRSESSSVSEPVSAEVEQTQTVDVKMAQTFQERFQPDAETVSKLESVPKADLPHTGRVQDVPRDRTPKLHRQQQYDPLSISDTVDLNPLTEENSPGLKGDQPQRLFAHSMSMDAAVREKVPTGQQDDPGIRPQAVKVKSASIYSVKDSVETGGMAAAASGASNADDNETPNMFLSANPSWKIASGEADALFQPLEPESGEMAVSFPREGQMEKTSWVKPSPNELRSEGQPFHAEVLKQVVEKTSTNLKSGTSEIRIDLKPESLGHLRLHVSTDHQQVTVKILAENPLVKDMIENQASLIKNELQQQGIHVNTIKVDMLMSDGSDFAYSQHEGTAFKQDRHEPAFGGGKDYIDDSASKEPESLSPASNRGGSLVNYFA